MNHKIWHSLENDSTTSGSEYRCCGFYRWNGQDEVALKRLSQEWENQLTYRVQLGVVVGVL